MKKCNLAYYKYFLPQSKDVPPTTRQLDMMKDMTKERKSKYMAFRSWLDSEDKGSLSKLAAIKKEKFAAQSQLNWSQRKIDDFTEEQAENLAQKIKDVNGDLSDPGMLLLQNRVRGDVFNAAEKELVTRTFLNRLNNLDLLTKQIDRAVETGNEAALEALAIEMNKTAGAFAAYFGDINATSAAFRQIARMNNSIKQGRRLEKLFENGGC